MAGGGMGGAALGGMLEVAGMGLEQMRMDEAQRRMSQAYDISALQRDLDLTGIDPYQQLDYAGDFNPAAYDTPEAAQYKTIEEDPATRAIQMQALQQLVAQGNGAMDAQNAAGRFHALDSASQMANQREGAIRQQMERKGQGGTGANALMQAQAAQMGANRAQQGTLDAYSQAALQKLAAMQGAVGAAGQVRGQDLTTQRYNTDTINDFNQFNTAARNRINQMNTGMQNDASLRNLNTKQDISGRNTGIANQQIDRTRQDRTAMNSARNARLQSQANVRQGQSALSQQQAPMYGQMGQQANQLFTNIGAGMEAHANSQQPKNEFTSDDGSFHSQWW